MNWEAIGAIGEIIGAFAVFVSLVYLASQIKVSNKAARNASHQEIMDSILRVQSDIASSTEASDIYRRGMLGDETLSEAELTRLRLFLNQIVALWERAYYLAKDGEVDPWLNGQLEYLRTNLAGSPGFQSWFEARREMFSEEFQRVINNHIAQAEKYDPLGVKEK